MEFRLFRTTFNSLRLVIRAGYISNQSVITVAAWNSVISGRDLTEDIHRCLPFFYELGLVEKDATRHSYVLREKFLELGKAIHTRDEANERKIWRALIENHPFFRNVIDKISFLDAINGFVDIRELKEEIIRIAGREKQSRTDRQYFNAYAPAIINLLRHVKIIENISRFRVKRAFEVPLGDETDNLPPEIRLSLKKFREDNPVIHKTAFIIMQFGKTPAHQSIVESIKEVFEKYGIVALRADDKEYHSSLLGNVLTYIYGCNMSVAVFERIEADRFNPNVSFEVGYMRALNKPVCLLKDKTMSTLQTDLLGELYKSFDPQDPKGSIPPELEKWLKDRGIVS